MTMNIGMNEVVKVYLTEDGNIVAESDVKLEDPVNGDEPVTGD